MIESIVYIAVPSAIMATLFVAAIRALDWPAWPSIAALSWAMLLSSNSLFVAFVFGAVLATVLALFRHLVFQVWATVVMLFMIAMMVVNPSSPARHELMLLSLLALPIGLAVGSFRLHSFGVAQTILIVCLSILVIALLLMPSQANLRSIAAFLNPALSICLLGIGLQLGAAANARIERERVHALKKRAYNEIDRMLERSSWGVPA
ncbi:hypothetical protein [Terricaulis silvestris]|uniref:Uncharacterized protein n=1 Tax=Terricaulis silvestris TaxID=2686094 RepID=A0A6I6MLJ2_9CAUL|nr:hypothetical protein [Terricaulis silvestris]QGZ94076.1 hypothetical protein DSM104635_00892 [Terricaulis silvestris]